MAECNELNIFHPLPRSKTFKFPSRCMRYSSSPSLTSTSFEWSPPLVARSTPLTSVAAPVSRPRTLSTKRAACAWVVMNDAVSTSIGVGRRSVESGTAAERNGPSADRETTVLQTLSWLRSKRRRLLRAAAVVADVARSMSGASRMRVIFLGRSSDDDLFT